MIHCRIPYRQRTVRTPWEVRWEVDDGELIAQTRSQSVYSYSKCIILQQCSALCNRRVLGWSHVLWKEYIVDAHNPLPADLSWRADSTLHTTRCFQNSGVITGKSTYQIKYYIRSGLITFMLNHGSSYKYKSQVPPALKIGIDKDYSPTMNEVATY